MKYYKYYETTAEYEKDAPNIGEYEHYTIYINDTKTSLINSKYIGEPSEPEQPEPQPEPFNDSYFVYQNNDSHSIRIASNTEGIKQAICLNNMSAIKIPASGVLMFNTEAFGPDTEIRIHIEFKHAAPNLNGLFRACTDLIAVRGNVFESCPSISECLQLFAGCTGLTELSESMFRLNTDIENVAATFADCKSLESIPENIFKYNTYIATVDSMFKGCTALTSIPNNLFKYNKDIKSFNNCFNGCTGLKGHTPNASDAIQLWDRAGKPGYPASISGTGCFKGCTGLDEYDLNVDNPIPANWGGDTAKTITVMAYPTKVSSHTINPIDGTYIKLVVLSISESGTPLPTDTKLKMNITYQYDYSTGSIGQVHNIQAVFDNILVGAQYTLNIIPLLAVMSGTSSKYYGITTGNYKIDSADKRYELNIVKPNITLHLSPGVKISNDNINDGISGGYYYLINRTELSYPGTEISETNAFLGITDLTYSFAGQSGIPGSKVELIHNYTSPSGSDMDPDLLPEVFTSASKITSISGWNLSIDMSPDKSPFYDNIKLVI